MPSDRTVRWSAFGFAIFFAIVVVLGYIPGLNAAAHHHHGGGGDPDEHTMMGLYSISLIDDVTHGLSALLLLAAALTSARMSRLALGAFGWYYACDATFYLVTGLLKGDPFMSNILLNLPHVVISSTMLMLAFRGRMDVPRSQVKA